MSDDEMTHDQRLRNLAGTSLAGYKAGKVSLRALIDDLDNVWNGLEQSEWSDEFRGHWWTLEQVYSVALDRGELDSLSRDFLAAIDEATSGLETLVDSWPANATRPL
jgi:hypothetical protein